MVVVALVVCAHPSTRAKRGSARRASRSAMVSRVVIMDVVESVVPVQQEPSAQMVTASIV